MAAKYIGNGLTDFLDNWSDIDFKNNLIIISKLSDNYYLVHIIVTQSSAKNQLSHLFTVSTMSTSLVHIPDARVRQLLDWESVVSTVESALIAVAEKRAVQNPRSFTNVLGSKDVLLCMPGYLKSGEHGTLACKMVTAFTGNESREPPLPSILANIFLFDDKTGQLKSIIEAVEITAWRTAAASVVATKYLHFSRPNRQNNILAILGAGTQGRIHAIAFHHVFKFKEIRIWNHRVERAQKLTAELKSLGIPAKVFESGEDCVKNADVIITATFAMEPILYRGWIKPNVHINAVGAGTNHHSEICAETYQAATIYVDHMDGARVELKGLEDLGVELTAEVGEIITGKLQLPLEDKITIFHSLGMAAEDAAVGQLIYDRHLSEQKK